MNVHVKGSGSAKQGHSARPPKVNLKAPRVAWWTLGLFVGCVVVWVSLMVMTLWGVLSLWVGLPLLSIFSFVAFTPMHDASHRSIARARWVNEVVGRCCALLLAAPFPAFRYVHLEHHKHTNHDEKDPDMWSGRGPVWLLPLRWLTQDLHYYVVYLSNWSKRSKAERWETVLTLCALVTLVGGLLYMGASLFVLCWLCSARVGIGILAYSFDYLPHKPHHITSSEDRYKATLVRPSPLLTPLFLYQNYHLIHHLYPGVPFYRYGEIWRAQKDFLIAQGTEVRSLLGQRSTPDRI